MGGGVTFLIVIVGLYILSSLKVIQEYERGIKFTFGKYVGVMNPGLRVVIPIVQSYQKVDMRVKTVDVPGQECVTRDNISVHVNAVLFYRIAAAEKAVLDVESYAYATSQLAQTTMRNIVGEVELDELLANREQISERIREIVDKQTDPWGVKVETEAGELGYPFMSDTTSPSFKLLEQALTDAYDGIAAVSAGMGGSIPLTTTLAGINPTADIVLLGVPDSESRIHSTNESVHPEEIRRIALGEALFLQRLAASK